MEESQEKLLIHISNELFVPSAFKSVDGSFILKELHTLFDDYFILCPIKYHVDITNTGDAFLLSGRAECTAQTSCSRCLDKVKCKLSGIIDAYYLINSPDNEEDEKINEFEILPEDHNIDLAEVIRAALIIDAPDKPLCKDDCKGLCYKCGANLNFETCNCKEEINTSNPFSVLKDIKL